MAADNSEQFSEAQFEIIVRYQSKEIRRDVIDCSNGCCVYCREHSCEHAPLRKRLALPYVDEDDQSIRKETVNLTNTVLTGMSNGLLLEFENGCLYAKRRCRTVVYCHSSQYHANNDPIKIQTNQKVKIFDYPAFKRQFISWLTRKMDRSTSDKTEPFKRHKIFFSFGQTWQPYLERHEELGENRPQPTALDTRLVTMVVVPMNAKDMVMATQEGRESSETITMGLNQHFFFFSLEGSSQICNSLEIIKQRCRQQIEDENTRQMSEESVEPMSTNQEESIFDKLLSDCLDLQESLDARTNEALQRQCNTYHGNHNPHQRIEQPFEHRFTDQQQLMEYQTAQQVEQHQQSTEQQQHQIEQQQYMKQQWDRQQQQRQHNAEIPSQLQPHTDQRQQENRVPQQHRRHPLELRLQSYDQSHASPATAVSSSSSCKVTDDGIVYFNWGNGTEVEVGLTSEEWMKLVSVIETEKLLPE